MSVVYGYKHITAKNSGIRYTELHLLSDDRFIVGQRADVVFILSDSIENFDLLDIGVQCSVVYNRFGRVESVRLFV